MKKKLFIIDNGFSEHIPNGLYWVKYQFSPSWEVVSVSGNRYFKIGSQYGYDLDTVQEWKRHPATPIGG